MEAKSELSKGVAFKAWVGAMRLRTLPLAISTVLTGAFLAMHNGHFNGVVLSLTLITAIILQINSNLANDYGDFKHGTDNEERLGPERAIQSGIISEKSMLMVIYICSVFAFAFGTLLIWKSGIPMASKFILLLLGIAAIYASVKYTVGNNPFGYRGLGDISVIFFFGLLGVVGSYFLQSTILDVWVLLPAIAIGCFSAAVLNVNNIRDIKNDQKSGKITMAVKLGADKARIYHVGLLSFGMGSLFIYAYLRFNEWTDWLFLLSFPFFIVNAIKIMSIKESKKLDPYLKQLALSTFSLSILMGLSLLFK